MSKYILGFNLDTKGARASIYDQESKLIGTGYEAYPSYYPQEGWVEQDANEIYVAAKDAAAQAFKASELEPTDIAAIGIANQRDTAVFWDKETGQPVCPAIVWQDRRSVKISDRLGMLGGKDLVRRTGMAIMPNATATKIAWVLENNKEIKESMKAGKVLYGTVDSWLVWKLTGKSVHVTDHSNNSVTLLQDAETLDYDKELLKSLRIPSEILPKICKSSEVYGTTDKDEFFGAEVPIAGIVGDQQARALGLGVLHEGTVQNTYGVGSFIIMNTGSKYIAPSEGVFSPVYYSVKDRTNFCMEGKADVSTSVFDWLRDKLGIVSGIEEAEEMAREVENNGGVYFVPAFVGLGTPYNDPYARATIFGLSRSADKRHIARAALESMAFQVYDAVSRLERRSGTKITHLRADGEGAKSDFMLQFQADILGVSVERSAIEDSASLGAAYMAGLAVGYWDSIEQVSKRWKVEKSFEPIMSDKERQDQVAMWTKAIGRASGWLRR